MDFLRVISDLSKKSNIIHRISVSEEENLLRSRKMRAMKVVTSNKQVGLSFEDDSSCDFSQLVV